ncbi:MAG: TetR/AcrR family transcriptional regulator [Planctomycetes bacterium]|nr:TetR/AcrR family transcriptional regulator [Planctomycetota bacterium]
MGTAQRRQRGRPRDEALITQRQEEILATATRMFAQRGFPATDLQEVADALGVGKGTVYRYFPSKRELFLAAADRAMVLLSARVHEAADTVDDPLARIRRAIEAYLTFFDEQPELIELLIQERAEFRDRKTPTYFEHREANMGPWEALLRDLIAAGRIRDVPVARITGVISDLLYGTIFTNHFAGRKKPLHAQSEDVLDILFNGLLVDRGPGPRAGA